MSQHRVLLEVPALPEYVQVVRMTGAAVVSQYGATYDAIDDIRMLVDEAFIMSLEALGSTEATISFEFDVIDTTVFIEVQPRGAEVHCDKEAHSFGLAIIEALCDSCELDNSSGNCVIRLIYRWGQGS